MTRFLGMPALTPAMVKARVDEVQTKYRAIEHEAWNERKGMYSKPEMQMWAEASQIIEDEWREIIRVLAQGGEYYSIVWPEVQR